MDIKKAIKIIQDRADIYGMPMLETLIVMQELAQNGELNEQEYKAFNRFMADGRKFFAPAV